MSLNLREMLKEAKAAGACQKSLNYLAYYDDVDDVANNCTRAAYYAHWYAKHVIGGPFPALEGVIAADAFMARHYAVDVLKGPFPAGEKYMKQFPDLWQSYKEYFNL